MTNSSSQAPSNLPDLPAAFVSLDQAASSRLLTALHTDDLPRFAALHLITLGSVAVHTGSRVYTIGRADPQRWESLTSALRGLLGPGTVVVIDSESGRAWLSPHTEAIDFLRAQDAGEE